MFTKLRLSLLALAALPLTACLDPGEVSVATDRVQATLLADPLRLEVRNADGDVVLQTLSGGDDARYGGFATTYDWWEVDSKVVPGWDPYVPGEEPWRAARTARLERKDDRTLLAHVEQDELAGELEVKVDGLRVFVSFRPTPTDDGEAFHKTGVALARDVDERYFGLGERYASVDHAGLSLYGWAEEAGVGQGEDEPLGPGNPFPNGPSMTYFPVPFFHSSAGFSAYLDTTRYMETHLGSERDDGARLSISGPTFDAIFYVTDDPLEALDAYTADSGKPPVPADWVFGPRRRVNPYQEVDGEQEWRLLRERGVPTTGLDDSVHLLPHRSELGREEQLMAWTSEMHDNGFKVMAYNNPYISLDHPRSQGDRDHGRDNDLFVLDGGGDVGETFFISGSAQALATIDLTKPEGVAWFQDLLRRSLALGYDGWMHDFGEYLERPWRLSDGRTGAEVHNEFPVLSAKAAYELLEEEKPDDYLFFVRSGWSGTQRYVPAVWSGDPEATFDETQGLPAMLRGGLNLAMSGVPYWGSDISGFKCITDDPRDKEIYLRWTQVGAVSPIMMDQNACVGLLSDLEKWTLWSDEETWTVYGEMARLHTRLSPYFNVLAEEAHLTGAPIMRHPFLLFPHEPDALDVEFSFFLGPALYAAPVVRRGERERDAWLPPGAYVDLDDHTVYEGGAHVTIPAPLQKLPLLLVAGEVLPLLDESIETLAPATVETVVTPADVADRLDVKVALRAGDFTEASLRLDDGTVLRAGLDADAQPSTVTDVDEATLPGCASCVLRDAPGDVTRVRANSELAADTELVVDGVRLTAEGGPDRRVRWEVFLLP